MDLEGCVGGSLDHGEEHDQNTHSNRDIKPELPTVKVSITDARKGRDRMQQNVVGQVQPHRGLNAARLRQAVVTSEILSRPVAMRGGRRYGVR